MERKTPLYETHLRYGGKMVPFGGYLLPVQYQGVIAEHMAVRTACGLFDVSHMCEFLCEGPRALENLNWLLTNDFSGMRDGQARYSPLCNETGGVVDDLLVYKEADNRYLIVANASNREKDFTWMQQHRIGGCTLTDLSDQIAQLALQGPRAQAILEKLTDPAGIPTRYYTASFHRPVDGVDCMISRTGYTGEDGFELYFAPHQAPRLWDALLEAGKAEGLVPCGLGARDTLRLEAGMPLYGHELTEEITPLEAGLGFFVKMSKEDFIGKAALLAQGEPTRRRVGLKVTGRGIVREHQTVYCGGEPIGETTSGTHCPFLGCAVAMALLPAGQAEVGTAVEADVRGRRVAAEIVPLPFYKRGQTAL